MTSEIQETPDTDLNALLNEHFAGKIVRKDLTKRLKEGADVPVFVLEYLLGNYCSSQDQEVVNDGLETVKRILAENFVRPDEAEKVKSLIREKGTYKVIDKVSVELNEKRDVYEASLFSLGIKGVVVPTATVKQYEKLLVGGIWSLITLEYFFRREQLQRVRAGAPRYGQEPHLQGSEPQQHSCLWRTDVGGQPLLQPCPTAGWARRGLGRRGL
jgi:ATP-dependent Lon protease